MSDEVHELNELLISFIFIAERYLRMPVKVITMTTNETQYIDGLRYFTESFNRTNDVDTPMELEIIQTTVETYETLGWRAKILYVLKVLRCGQPLFSLCDRWEIGVIVQR